MQDSNGFTEDFYIVFQGQIMEKEDLNHIKSQYDQYKNGKLQINPIREHS